MGLVNSRDLGSKHRITVSGCYNIYPVITGGQQRIYHLYKNLSSLFDIRLITYSDCGTSGYTKYLSPGLLENSIPFSELQAMKEKELKPEYGQQVYEYSIMNLYELTPDYLTQLEAAVRDSEVTILSHPYTFPAAKHAGAKRIWYDAHNVEYEIKRMTIGNILKHMEFLEQVRKVEEECCKTSELVMVCSEMDKLMMSSLYGINPDKVIIVPNGSDVDSIKCVLPDKRYRLKRKSRNSKNFTAFFIGAYYEPNFTAVEHILNLAKQLNDINFIIAGDVCNYFDAQKVPGNVRLEGRIDDDRKSTLLNTCDIALNPMLQGSGTNLKMLEYFACGIPVITTPVGARGFKVENGIHCIVCNIEYFPFALRKYMMYSIERKKRLVQNARSYVERNFDWKMIAEKTGEHMLKLLDTDT